MTLTRKNRFARRRAVQGLVVVMLYSATLLLVERRVWTTWWFYVGAGLVAAWVFVEPFYARPQDVVVTVLGGVGAVASADRDGAEQLWTAYACFVIVIGLTAVFAALGPPGRWTKAATRASTSLGRSLVIGEFALVTDAVRAAAAGERFDGILGGAAVLYVGLSVDWASVLRTLSSPRGAEATVRAVVGPNLLLIAGAPRELLPGAAVELRTDGTEVAGVIVSIAPDEQEVQHHVALAKPWFEALPRHHDAVAVKAATPSLPVAGIVVDGTTTEVVELATPLPTKVGSVLDSEGNLLQVVSSRVEKTTWLGEATLAYTASAVPLGRVEEGRLQSPPRVPFRAHTAVVPTTQVATVPPNFLALGVLVGTSIEVGLDGARLSEGHLAILGMSGMGKTTVANRVARYLAPSRKVLALDTTGEYRNRRGFPKWPGSHTRDVGLWVYEPGGEPTEQACNHIRATIEAGYAEYAAGEPYFGRTILLEEAHAFLPEYNICSFKQRDSVAESTRYIMQSRKFGMSFIFVSQRTAVISKSALSQCENYIVLRTVDDTGISYVSNIAGDRAARALPALARYQAVCFGPAFNVVAPAVIDLYEQDPL